MSLEEACDAAWKWSQKHCRGCRLQKESTYWRKHNPHHTCYGDIEAVKAVALAAAEYAADQAASGNDVYQSAVFETKAEIESYLGVKP